MEKLRVAFMGSPAFAVPSLEALCDEPGVEVVRVVTQPDKPSGRGQRLAPPPVFAAAIARGIERDRILQPVKLRTPPLAEALSPLALDLIVVVAYGRILPPDLLAVPRLGCWNVHGSLLPAYRGAAPIQWAVLRGERVTGVTLMQMEAGLDTGPMLLSRQVEIGDDDTAGTLFEKLAPVGAALLVEGIRARARLVAVRQDDAQATLAPLLAKEQGRVDFTEAARRVRDHVRGMDPWPGAFTALRGEVLKVWRARLVDEAARAAAPGTLLSIEEDGVRVACGEGIVALAEGQLPGRKRLPLSTLAAGRAIAVGDVLGA